MNIPTYHSGEGWYPDSEPDVNDDYIDDEDEDVDVNWVNDITPIEQENINEEIRQIKKIIQEEVCNQN